MTASPVLTRLVRSLWLGTTTVVMSAAVSAAPAPQPATPSTLSFSLPGLNGVDVSPAEAPSPDLTQEDEALMPENDEVVEVRPEPEAEPEPEPALTVVTLQKTQTLEKAPAPEAKPEVDSPVVEEKDDVAQKDDAPPLPVLEPYVEAFPPTVITLFGITPYVTTKDEMKARFAKTLQSASDTLVNTDQVHDPDIELGGAPAEHLLLSYTEAGTVSDIYLTFEGISHEEALERLKTLLAPVDPDGIWTQTPEGDVWRNAQSEVVLLAERASLVMGAVARHARETDGWMKAHPEVLPHFGGLVVGQTQWDEVPAKLKATCERFPFAGRDGARFMRLEGVCLGVPGETETTLRFDENGQTLVELSVHFKPNPTTYKALSAALQKRFTYSEESGVYQSGVSPAKNVWVPTAELESDRLSFRVYRDGVKAAHDAWVKAQKAKRDAQAERERVQTQVESLFE